MKLTAKVKLDATQEQNDALLATLERCNEACNWISQRAWDAKTFGQFALHKLVYYETRQQFNLNSSLVVRCIAKVAEAYKLGKRTKRVFKQHGALAFDHNILHWYIKTRRVSIASIGGRLKIGFLCGDYMFALLQTQQGESDLAFVNGEFYLFAPCNIEEPSQSETKDVLGIDMGIVNLASDSDGTSYSGAEIEKNRRIHAHRRRNLQRKRTKSAKRKLKKLSGKQARFQRDCNHKISKAIVQNAQDTNRAIALEDLSGIRERTTARRKQRARHDNWAFRQLRTFIEYKARLAGITVFIVDPRYTSQTCPVCGSIDRANRRSQSLFSCVHCGYSAPADTNAAVNIAARAAVNRPMVSDVTSSHGAGDKLATTSN